MWGTSATACGGMSSEWVHLSLHHPAVLTQLSGTPILTPVLFMHVGDPYT